MAFERWKSWFERSRAFHRFKAHHTEINDLYWALAPAAGYTKYLSRHAPVGTTPTTLFHVGGVHARRIAPNLPVWNRHFRDFENWVRLSMLVSALSYLETYISTIVTTALRSDPLLRYGQSRAIDGTLWLKKHVKD